MLASASSNPPQKNVDGWSFVAFRAIKIVSARQNRVRIPSLKASRYFSPIDPCTHTPMLETHDPNPFPTNLLHYRLGRSLGEGGFGQVFEAWDAKLDRQVAIKYLKHVVAGADLLKEARLAASLQHPAFIKIHALERDGDSQAIVMELVPGQTLRQVQEARPFSVPEVLEMVRQVALAMQEAHAADLIHGDLKPSNLMREPGGAIRILDFGLASRSGRDATTSLVQADPQGTIAYMAPEILTGAMRKSSADIYALGVILYELLTGSRPFNHLSGLALAAALMQSNSQLWPWPEQVPLALRHLMCAMTARSLALRIGSMQEVAERCTKLAKMDAREIRQFPTITHSSSASDQNLNLTQPQPHPQLQPQPQTPEVSKRAPSALLTAKQAWSPKAKRAVLMLGLVGALYGLWQSQVYWPQLSSAIKPYSESQEMNQGLAALDQFDRQEMLDEALLHFSAILRHSPDHAGSIAGLSLTYSLRYLHDVDDEAQLQKAEEYAAKALKLNDLLAMSHIAVAQVAYLRHRSAPALAALERAFGLDPHNRLAWRLKINVLMQEGRFVEARRYAEEAALFAAQDRIFVDQLGQIELLQANFKAAEIAFRRSLQLQAQSVIAYQGLAQALLNQDRGDEALTLFKDGIKIASSADLLAAYGHFLFARGDYVSAAKAYENAVASDTANANDARVWANLGDTLTWIAGRNEEAKHAYEEARKRLSPKLEQSPKNAKLSSRIALYAAKTGDHETALTLVQSAQNGEAKNSEVQFRAAITYEIMGRRNEALAAIALARKGGYPIKLIDAEPELVALRRDPNYIQ